MNEPSNDVVNGPTADPWESHAAWWQEEFTDGADPEYVEQILPLIGSRLIESGTVLDIGCGEGQISRLATRAGLAVIGIDPAFAQVSEALRRSRRDGGAVPAGGRDLYAQGSALDLPVADGSIDMAIACLVFEHIPDVDGALREVARVLAPGGRFLFLLNHPLLQTPGSGWIDDRMIDPPELYWRVGPYLEEADVVEEVEKDVFIRFFHRPLSRYLNTAFDAGLSLTRMLEPAPPAGFLARVPEYGQVAAIPRLLVLDFVRM